MDFIAFIVVLLALLYCCMWLITFHPPARQEEPVVECGDACAPLAGRPFKVMTWNIQYAAGKNYVFFYDEVDFSGPDLRPSRHDVEATLHEIARIISEEDPDLVLLQEVDEGARRTDYLHELDYLLRLLPGRYPFYTSTFYWKAAFVPDPNIFGAVGAKLAILSKSRITCATRHQLPIMPVNPVLKLFHFKRAILEVTVQRPGCAPLIVCNTHMESFAQGFTTMQQQVDMVHGMMQKWTAAGKPWLFTGDFNLVPPHTYHLLSDIAKHEYNKESEILPLMQSFRCIPNLQQTTGSEREQWFTFFSNSPRIGRPDRTLDYIFHSDLLTLGNHYVRQSGTRHISDHFPLLAEFELPQQADDHTHGHTQ